MVSSARHSEDRRTHVSLKILKDNRPVNNVYIGEVGSRLSGCASNVILQHLMAIIQSDIEGKLECRGHVVNAVSQFLDYE